jgi:teichuronic acid biosynthesis glycosyltransferase TuaC
MSRKLRVVFLVSGYPTPDGLTGGIFHQTLAEALVRAGAEVEVVAPLPRVPWPLTGLSQRWAGYARIPNSYSLGGIVVHRPRHWQVPRRNPLGVGHRGFARCLVSSIAQVPDVVHAHFAYPCGVAAQIAAQNWHVPVVLTLHGSDVNVVPTMSRRARRHFSTAVQKAAFVSAVSQALADQTERLTGRRPEVMPIGIDLRRYGALPEKAMAREAIGLPSAARIVLFVGSLLIEKGVLLLREALEKIGGRDILGVFVGEGPLRAQITNVPRILSVGPVPHAKVPLYMRAADVLVLPSFSEGMPTVVVEAGAAGLPVVATEVGGVGELLGADRGRLVAAGDAVALAAAIEAVLADQTAALERAERLKNHVVRSYDVAENARLTIRTYEALL